MSRKHESVHIMEQARKICGELDHDVTPRSMIRYKNGYSLQIEVPKHKRMSDRDWHGIINQAFERLRSIPGVIVVGQLLGERLVDEQRSALTPIPNKRAELE